MILGLEFFLCWGVGWGCKIVCGVKEVEVVGLVIEVCVDFVGVLVDKGIKFVCFVIFLLFCIIFLDIVVKFFFKDFFFFSLCR